MPIRQKKRTGDSQDESSAVLFPTLFQNILQLHVTGPLVVAPSLYALEIPAVSLAFCVKKDNRLVDRQLAGDFFAAGLVATTPNKPKSLNRRSVELSSGIPAATAVLFDKALHP
jgi:hypothetical protein